MQAMMIQHSPLQQQRHVSSRTLPSVVFSRAHAARTCAAKHKQQAVVLELEQHAVQLNEHSLVIQQQQQPEPQQQEQDLQQQPQRRQQPRFNSLVPAAIKTALQKVTSAVGAVDPRMRGLVLLNAMTLLMGSNWVVIKESNDAFDPVVFTGLRFTLAAAAFTPFLVKGLKDPSVRKAGLEVGAWTALGYLAQSWALFLTPASRASLLSTFTVIAVPCLAGLSGQRVKPLVWACGIAALLGTMLLEQGGGEPPNAGDLLSILSALFFAMQIFRTEKISRELPEGNTMPFMAITLATVALASCGSAVAVHWQDAASAMSSLGQVMASAFRAIGPGDTPADTAQPLFELMWTSFCSTDLVLLIELMALQSVSSTEAALIYSLEPVSGAAMAYAFLGERWGPLGWWGAGVILAASVACQLGGAFDDDQGKDGNKQEKQQKEAAS